MTVAEIDLTRAYLDGAGQDPVAALIWAVKDLARERRRPSSCNDRDHDATPLIEIEAQRGQCLGAGFSRDS